MPEPARRERPALQPRAPATVAAITAVGHSILTAASYNGIWGYSALIVSLANTAEPLYQALHGANRPSHEGVIPLYDRSIELCRRAGFTPGFRARSATGRG